MLSACPQHPYTLQSLQSYHNAYKLIHQPARKADSGGPADGAVDAPPAEPAQAGQAGGEAKGRGRRAAKPKGAASPTTGATGSNSSNGANGSNGSHPLGTSTGPDALVSFLTSPDFAGQGGSTSSTSGAAAAAATATPTTTATASGNPDDHQLRQQQRHRQKQRQQQQLQTATGGDAGEPHSSSSASFGGGGDMRPYSRHSVALPAWQPPPSSLQARTALTRAISTCPTYTRLHQLLLDNALDFNVYHSCAALSRVLALHRRGLSPRESRLFKEGCSTLQVRAAGGRGTGRRVAVQGRQGTA